jgi:hypothetical protein
VTEIVSDTHKSSRFIALLTKLDAAYPPTHKLRLILDNHSTHTSKETQRWLAGKPQRLATKQELIERIHLYFWEVNAAPVVLRWKYKMDETVIAWLFRER